LEFYFRFRFWPYHRARQSACHSALGCRISSNRSILIPQRIGLSIFKMSAAEAQFYFGFQIGWRSSFPDVSFYQQTEFRSYYSIRGWDITISDLEKQTSAILRFYSRFSFRPYHRSRQVILHQSAKFHPHRTAHGKKWRHADFQNGRYPLSWIRVQ